MSPIEEIKAILRECVSSQDGYEADYRAQLAAIESLESDAAALRKALEPFGKYLDGLGSVWAKLDSFTDDTTAIVLLGDLRRAARALKGQP